MRTFLTKCLISLPVNLHINVYLSTILFIVFISDSYLYAYSTYIIMFIACTSQLVAPWLETDCFHYLVPVHV